ncbi:hypothetical protein [Microbacterium sp. NPDC077486]|uniref:hypothetical protein n=1 Tax=Microbacterium sp. NPDC077486 TaxID=3154766 RepID=UPI00343C66A0
MEKGPRKPRGGPFSIPRPGRGRRITAGEWDDPESLAVPDWPGLVDADLLYR